MLVLIDEIVGWRAGLDDLLARFAHRFGRAEPRWQALTYLVGLLSPLASKNGWTLAEAAGDATPDRMQRLLNRSAWDPGSVRDNLFAYVSEHLGDDDGVSAHQGLRTLVSRIMHQLRLHHVVALSVGCDGRQPDRVLDAGGTVGLGFPLRCGHPETGRWSRGRGVPIGASIEVRKSSGVTWWTWSARRSGRSTRSPVSSE